MNNNNFEDNINNKFENIEDMDDNESEPFTWILRQGIEILKKEEIKRSLKEQYTNLVKIIFEELNVYIYIIIILVLFIFIMLIIILFILVIRIREIPYQ